MLNYPLSLLSDDLLAYIVEHIARLPFGDQCLYNLSITDRAFTQSCQSYIFRTLNVDYSLRTKREVTRKLGKMRKILNHNPSFANRVRVVQLMITRRSNTWLFNDPTFVYIFQSLAKSPIPPQEFCFGGFMYAQLKIEDPIHLMGRLMQSFISQTLTTLHLTYCVNIPLPLLLICSGLKEVTLDHVGVVEQSYSTYPDTQCIGREAPALVSFDYRDSASLVKQIITPPPRFHTPIISWSNLRNLTLSPHEEEELACLQPILNEACNSLEELYLTKPRVSISESKQLPLAGLANLSNISSLRVFSLCAILKCGADGSGVLQDINTVLHTIPTPNRLTNLAFDFTIFGKHPFDGCLDQDWIGICDEAVRISAGKPLELDLQTVVSLGNLEYQHPGQNELFTSIIERTTSLSEHPNICIHFWNPTYWDRGIGPSPNNQVRSRCRR